MDVRTTFAAYTLKLPCGFTEDRATYAHPDHSPGMTPDELRDTASACFELAVRKHVCAKGSKSPLEN